MSYNTATGNYSACFLSKGIILGSIMISLRRSALRRSDVDYSTGSYLYNTYLLPSDEALFRTTEQSLRANWGISGTRITLWLTCSLCFWWMTIRHALVVKWLEIE